MSEATAGRQFHKDLAKEKARIYGIPRRKEPRELEIAARKWQAEQERTKEQPLQPEVESLFTAAAGAHAKAIMQPTPPAEGDWAQFNPWQAADEEAQKPRRVNTVTIFSLAKKIMAQEWRRAKGIKRHDPRLVELEKFAREYKARIIEREQEKRRQAIRLAREYKKILDCIGSFVDLMLDERKRRRIKSLEDVEGLIAAAFSSLGEVFDVEWSEDGGCAVWLKPWPERRKRRVRADVRPALRRLCLDARLNISAYDYVSDPAVRQEKQKDSLLRSLRLSENEIRRLRTPEEARDFLTEKAWEVGRVLDITLENGLWKIHVQPWDEVRVRNLNKKENKGPITEYEITMSKDLKSLSCKRLED